MQRILKRFLTRDPGGRAIAANTERLIDDGRGRMQVTTVRTAAWCPGCRRPVSDLGDLRGRCDWCRFRGCCVHCATQCQVCHRQLCGICRRGFPGPPPMTACPICLSRLFHRQASMDRLQNQQLAWERQQARLRQIAQLHALQLQAGRTRLMTQLQGARLRLTTQLQAARLRTSRDLAITREMNRLRLALIQVIYRGR